MDYEFNRILLFLTDFSRIIEGNWTPQAAKIATLAAAEMTPYACEKLFQELGALAPSKSSLDR